MTDPRALGGGWPGVRRAIRGVGAAFRRVVPADGTDAQPPIVVPARGAILVLQLQQVGDSLMMSPVLRAIRRRYPDAAIDMLSAPVGYAVHRHSPHIRHHYVARWDAGGAWPRRSALGAWLHVLHEVRRTRYDCVISCVNQVSLPYILPSIAARARHRIGFNAGAFGFLFTRRLAVPDHVSVLAANLALARAVDANPADGAEEFWFDGPDEVAATALLEREGVGPSERLVVMHPASNWQSKTWFPDRWAAVADRLAKEDGLRPVFVGTARDAAMVRMVQHTMQTPSTTLAGETDLGQLGALLARAELFVGSDSGPRHVAGALGRPQVTVMSSLDESWRWGLDRPTEVVLRTDPSCHGCLLRECSHRQCLDLISVDAVMRACRVALHRGGLPVASRLSSFN